MTKNELLIKFSVLLEKLNDIARAVVNGNKYPSQLSQQKQESINIINELEFYLDRIGKLMGGGSCAYFINLVTKADQDDGTYVRTAIETLSEWKVTVDQDDDNQHESFRNLFSENAQIEYLQMKAHYLEKENDALRAIKKRESSFSTALPYMDDKSPNFAPKLKAAIDLWMETHIEKKDMSWINKPGNTIRDQGLKWLEKNYNPRMSEDFQIDEDGRKQIVAVVRQWKIKPPGQAPKNKGAVKSKYA